MKGEIGDDLKGLEWSNADTKHTTVTAKISQRYKDMTDTYENEKKTRHDEHTSTVIGLESRITTITKEKETIEKDFKD